jgi:hypothetical protein
VIDLGDPKYRMDVLPGCEDVDPRGLTVEQATTFLAEHDNHEPSRCQVRIQMRMWLVHEQMRRRERS